MNNALTFQVGDLVTVRTKHEGNKKAVVVDHWDGKVIVRRLDRGQDGLATVAMPRDLRAA